MKKAFSFLTLLCILLSFPAFAEESSLKKEDVCAYFDSLSIDDLLELRIQLNMTLYTKGYEVYYTLTRGDKGEDVLRLQTKLQELGYFNGKLNGKYDTETQKAMKQFEKANGLTNDGDASAEDQQILFSLQFTPSDTKNNDDENEENSSLNPQKQKLIEMDEKYSDYEEIDYGELARNPEDFFGKKVKLIGKIIQILGSRSEGYQARLATSGSSDVIYVMINFDPGYNLLENDRLVVYGTLINTITYETTIHTKVTIPAAIAEDIVLK